ncbi:hypothetical protein REPUB_Repub14bG0082000 [Reevesia pubescens]
MIELDFNDSDNVMWNGILRMKVVFKVDEPLKTCFILKRSSKPATEIPFKYERFSNFCYHCRRLGHVTKECCNRHDGTKKSLYGHWMRTVQSSKKNNSLIKIRTGSIVSEKSAKGEDEVSGIHAKARELIGREHSQSSMGNSKAERRTLTDHKFLSIGEEK